MFYCSVLILVAAFWSVDAAFNPNIYKYDLEPLTQDLDSCDYPSCDQLCRRMGFPGGACVGDRCKCDIIADILDEFNIPLGFNIKQNILRAEEKPEESDIPLNDVLVIGENIVPGTEKPEQNELPEDDVVLIDQEIVPDSEKSEENEKEAVVIVLLDQEIVPDSEKSEVYVRSSVSRGSCDCDPRSCEVYCFRIRYTGGICLTGQCRCYK